MTNEKILIRINGVVKILEIGRFVDELMELKGFLKLNDSEILPLNDLETYVPSLDQDEKIQWKRVIECSRHKSNSRLMKIKTASGREIRCTDAHSFVTRIDNSVVPLRGRDLKVGNRVPVLNSFYPDSHFKSIKISDFLKNSKLFLDMEEDFLYKPGTRAKTIRNTLLCDWSTGWFIGAYLSEGCAVGGTVGISNLNDNYINNAKVFINDLGLSYTEDFHHRGFADGRDLKVNSTLLANFLINSCGQGSNFKKVPEFAYNASDEFVSGLLRGYFDGDGNFHVDRKMIRCSSNSK
ncbi:intein-containing DNA-directed RNA polymerase subunit A'', partial [Candidatus Woesearchaeota archaeon]|nr:intein-containing DNA-directed RNA polymerase subunit A'' [Candidatus Woesearchaeota archaeon]